MLISQELRPNELVRFKTPHYGLAPIAGLQMQDDVAAIGDQILLRCNRAEWETVERGYVFKDWHAKYYDANPVFLFKPFDEPIAAEAMAAAFDALARDAARVVTACRLYKTGHLLEPVYTVRFLVTGIFFRRAVGPYRTEYLAMPVDGLTWRLDANEAQDVGLIYDNLKIVEQTEGTEGLRAVIDQFNLSHTPTVPNYFSVHVLLTAMEMLFDGVSKRVALKTTRYDRALQILRWSQGDGLDPAFNEFYRNQIHSLRNAVHHHALRNSDIDLDKVKFRLQIPVGVGIRFLMRLHRTEVAASLTELKRAQGWQGLGPKDLLNGCLDRDAGGDPTALQELMKFQG
ncbi:MAG: hypothetical protein ACREXS_19490 [Gammaproteobacteria bacterium]